jgi:hypothetical protein
MSKVTQRQKLQHSTARTLAALLGSMPVAIAVGVALTAVLPLPLGQRYLVGLYSVFPLWTALSVGAFLASSGRRAWLALLGSGAAAALVASIALGLR